MKARPDLSGDWKLNLDVSVLSPHVATAVRSGSLRTDHREPVFSSHLSVVFEDKTVESKFELRSDDVEIVANTGDGQTIASRLRWDGDALLAAWRIRHSAGETTISFRYELRDDGRRLHAAEELRGGGRDQDNLWVFDRE
jgi:hypothetical protein